MSDISGNGIFETTSTKSVIKTTTDELEEEEFIVITEQVGTTNTHSVTTTAADTTNHVSENSGSGSGFIPPIPPSPPVFPAVIIEPEIFKDAITTEKLTTTSITSNNSTTSYFTPETEDYTILSTPARTSTSTNTNYFSGSGSGYFSGDEDGVNYQPSSNPPIVLTSTDSDESVISQSTEDLSRKVTVSGDEITTVLNSVQTSTDSSVADIVTSEPVASTEFWPMDDFELLTTQTIKSEPIMFESSSQTIQNEVASSSEIPFSGDKTVTVSQIQTSTKSVTPETTEKATQTIQTSEIMKTKLSTSPPPPIPTTPPIFTLPVEVSSAIQLIEELDDENEQKDLTFSEPTTTTEVIETFSVSLNIETSETSGSAEIIEENTSGDQIESQTDQAKKGQIDPDLIMTTTDPFVEEATTTEFQTMQSSNSDAITEFQSTQSSSSKEITELKTIQSVNSTTDIPLRVETEISLKPRTRVTPPPIIISPPPIIVTFSPSQNSRSTTKDPDESSSSGNFDGSSDEFESSSDIKEVTEKNTKPTTTEIFTKLPSFTETSSKFPTTTLKFNTTTFSQSSPDFESKTTAAFLTGVPSSSAITEYSSDSTSSQPTSLPKLATTPIKQNTSTSKSISVCSVNLCLNGGECYISMEPSEEDILETNTKDMPNGEIGYFNCYCVGDFTGRLCEISLVSSTTESVTRVDMTSDMNTDVTDVFTDNVASTVETITKIL